MTKEKKVAGRYTTTTDPEKLETFFVKPENKGSGNDLVYSILDALLQDWDRVK